MDEFIKKIQDHTKVKSEAEARMMAPLVLAYIGDALYEVFIRNYLINEMTVSVNQYHKRATHYVRAKAQSHVVHALESELSEPEWTIVKRGRNQKSATVPKNADLTEYKYATGFEALLGYLFYIGQYDRLHYLMSKAVALINHDLGDQNG